MRRARPLLFLLIAAMAMGSAVGAQAAKKRPPPPPVAKPADTAGLRPALKPDAKPPIALPPAMAPGLSFGQQSLAANGFANNGLRSGLPPMGDVGAQCRASCTATRITCDDDPATPVCASRWAVCIADCNR